MSRTMKLAGLVAVVALAVLIGAALPTSAYFPGEKEGQVLRHIVMYKFKDEVPPAQVEEVVAAFSKLPKQVEGIVGFEHGVNTSTEGKSDGLTHLFMVTFRDPEALAAYLKHPAHDEYVKVVKDRREKVIVFDYFTGVQ
ncbi:MAG TPA: Dabb family protein [Pirellulales bacterium]